MTDQYEGQGGSYVIDEAGARQLVERTRESGDDSAAAPAEPAADSAPAPDAAVAPRAKSGLPGFLPPGAPADPSTTTE